MNASHAAVAEIAFRCGHLEEVRIRLTSSVREKCAPLAVTRQAYLTVVQQITTVGYTPVVRKVKSDAGDRIIPLGPMTVAVLAEYVKMRQGWQDVSGDEWPNTGFFFVRPEGSRGIHRSGAAADLIPRKAV